MDKVIDGISSLGAETGSMSQGLASSLPGPDDEEPPTSASGPTPAHELLEAARSVLPNAYAPYSHFRVAAAVVTRRGNVFTGVNVENASYGLTVCAERSAIFAAVGAEGPTMEIQAIAIVCETPVECAPCGACRQVIHEFGPKAAIYFDSPAGVVETTTPELLPRAFRLI